MYIELKTHINIYKTPNSKALPYTIPTSVDLTQKMVIKENGSIRVLRGGVTKVYIFFFGKGWVFMAQFVCNFYRRYPTLHVLIRKEGKSSK